MIEGIRNYIKDDEFRFTIFSNKIDIVNYQKIVSLEDDKILFLGGNKKITIHGKNLILNKEVLIIGEVIKIEVGHE